MQKIVSPGGVEIFEQEDTFPVNFDVKHSSSEVTVQQLSIEGAFYLHNVLTATECKQFIEQSENTGYSFATVETMMGYVPMPERRTNFRCVWRCKRDKSDDSAQVLEKEGEQRKRGLVPSISSIWDRVAPYIPDTVNTGSTTLPWKPCGLSEQLQFYRYHPHQEYKSHFDKSYYRSPYEQSFLTMIIYLNDDFQGGETAFWLQKDTTTDSACVPVETEKKPYPSPSSTSTETAPEPLVVKVAPRQGSALLFWHGEHHLSPLHSGEAVHPHVSSSDDSSLKETQTSSSSIDTGIGIGGKYVLRTDIMYSYEPEEEIAGLQTDEYGIDIIY